MQNLKFHQSSEGTPPEFQNFKFYYVSYYFRIHLLYTGTPLFYLEFMRIHRWGNFKLIEYFWKQEVSKIGHVKITFLL